MDGKGAEKAALRLIARAEQCRAGLLRKLKARGFSALAAKKTVDALCEAGLVDDDRFACAWVDFRLRRCSESPRSLILRLRARGIKESAARQAVEDAVQRAGESVLLKNYLKKIKDEEGAPHLVERLRFEGFSPAVLEEFF